MRQIILGLIIIGVSFSLASAEPHKNPELDIKITAPIASVKSGADVYIKIQMTNISDHPVDCSSYYVGGTDRRFRIEVRGSNGNSMKKRDLHPEMMPGSLQGCTLQPGESTPWKEDRISWANDFTRPGKYRIQLARVVGNDEKDGLVESNTISITIVP